MKSTHGIVAGAAAALLFVAAPVIGADQRVRTSTSGATASNASHRQAVNGQPKSLTQYMELLKQSGSSLTSVPVLPRNASRSADTQMRLVRGGGNDNHPRTPLPCGSYTDVNQFEAEQGPFSRGLGNLEDFELTNGPANSLCIIDSPEFVDCTASGPDPSGFYCGGGGNQAVDANDVLKGVKLDTEPARGAGWWEELGIGPGFNGASSKYFLYNYFGDENVLTFPNSGAPTGCQTLSPGPNVAGFNLVNPFGGSTVSITVTLADGSVVDLTADINSFKGICCNDEIVEIRTQDDEGTTVGMDNIKWGANVSACPEEFAPIDLDDIHEGLEILEMKLDNFQCSGGGGSNS